MAVPTMPETTAPTLPVRHNVSTLLDRNLEAGLGAKVALGAADGQMTYQQLFEEAHKLRAGRPEVAG
ncbi:MAG TPA: hypothetical protein VFA45_14965 [Actinomycetes bacterium]|jgi:hypothetical protein|nr:hypothetical protein [Actinomycetes bacterium]